MKTCLTCNTSKDLTEYRALKTSPDGLHDRCAECFKKWRKDNHVARSERVGLGDLVGEIKTCKLCDHEFYRKSPGHGVVCPLCKDFRRRIPCPSCGVLIKDKSYHCQSCAVTTGTFNNNWRGGKSVHAKGYIAVLIDRRYRFEHQLVMEEHIGRELLKGENVHHINGVKDDNRIENLELWTRPQPAGCRAVELLAWAKTIVEIYSDLEKQDLI